MGWRPGVTATARARLDRRGAVWLGVAVKKLAVVGGAQREVSLWADVEKFFSRSSAAPRLRSSRPKRRAPRKPKWGC